MGDMAEVFNDLKAYKKEQREARAAVNTEALAKLGMAAREQSKNVFRIDTEQGAVMYYVSSNTWQHKGKVARGTAQDLKNWLRKRGL
jgi:uncharacterized membrane protein (DUF106 family)